MSLSRLIGCVWMQRSGAMPCAFTSSTSPVVAKSKNAPSSRSVATTDACGSGEPKRAASRRISASVSVVESKEWVGETARDCLAARGNTVRAPHEAKKAADSLNQPTRASNDPNLSKVLVERHLQLIASGCSLTPVSYTHLRAHETPEHLV